MKPSVCRSSHIKAQVAPYAQFSPPSFPSTLQPTFQNWPLIRRLDIMSVTRKILSAGNGADKPKQGETVGLEYVSNL